jgi:hypothetical protein
MNPFLRIIGQIAMRERATELFQGISDENKLRAPIADQIACFRAAIERTGKLQSCRKLLGITAMAVEYKQEAAMMKALSESDFAIKLIECLRQEHEDVRDSLDELGLGDFNKGIEEGIIELFRPDTKKAT